MMRTKSFLGWLDEGSNPNPMSVVDRQKTKCQGPDACRILSCCTKFNYI